MSIERAAYISLDEDDIVTGIVEDELSLMTVLTKLYETEKGRDAVARQMGDDFYSTPEQLALIGHLEGLTQYLFELAKQ
ncbi:hypothetical protein [Donghicola sp.]|jgi:hypothetical protein|uniref:hypothetical protein n=1 Tax=Donghicola sp. TaxID=1929294 RepID=UPI0025EBF203|nr:hypothetical protein [Donghicola sp.]MCT4576858.1 hypothetical protein [Donghicola sp.]